MAFLASSFGVSNGAGSETAHIYEGLENASNLLALSLTNSPNAPRAYLMCMVFDQDYVLIDPTAGGYDFYTPVPEAAATETQNISLEIDIPESAKYIYTYVANESAGTQVFFDDFTVSQLGVDITQETDYYPFGSILSHWQKEDYRYNYQSNNSEKDDETNFNHFQLREYDGITGRWMVPDPKRQYYSPYKAMGNNPINRVDPDGGDDRTKDAATLALADQYAVTAPTPTTFETASYISSLPFSERMQALGFEHGGKFNSFEFLPDLNILPVHDALSLSFTISGAYGEHGIGYTIGHFGGRDGGFFITRLDPHRFELVNNLSLGASLDITHFNSLTNRRVSFQDIRGNGYEFSGNILDVGGSKSFGVPSFDPNYSNYTRTYEAHQFNIGVGLPAGFTLWRTRTKRLGDIFR